ncbi:MAG TPA: hypothetical protein VG710_05470 [Opitutus sp.]|nr:hypothetical protein [Opitutus sp.]
MKLSGPTFALLAAMLPCVGVRGDTPPNPGFSQRDETFATSSAQMPAGRRAPPTAIVRPERTKLPLVAKQPAAGVRRVATIETAETRAETLRSFPVRRPQPSVAAVVSPAGQPAVHFWHWRANAVSPMARGFAGPLVAGGVDRPGGVSVAREVVSPAGLNRFVSHHGEPPPTPARPDAASTDSR